MLTLVPTPIGNLEDISLRSLKVLDQAQTILAEDTRNAKKLYSLYIERDLISNQRREFIALHSHNEKHFLNSLDPAFFDKNVVYVSDAGMPGISDPGTMLVSYCQQKGIDYDVLPGANALLTAYVMSGFTETEFLFFGFLPHKGAERAKMLRTVMQCGYTAIIYESPHRILQLFEELESSGSEQNVFAIKELTKMHQKWWKEKACELHSKVKNENLKGEWVVVFERQEAERDKTLSKEEILQMDLAPKVTAKLLSRITGEKTKDIYESLINQ